MAHKGAVFLHTNDRTPVHKIPVREAIIQTDVIGDHKGPKQPVHNHQIAAGVMSHSQIHSPSHV